MKWFFDRVHHKLWHGDPRLPGTYSYTNEPTWSCEAHGETTDGAQPLGAGTYTLGAPEYNEPEETVDLRSMGPYFIPINGDAGHAGVGIHGGGSAASHPLAAQQGWFPTHRCIRVQNDDLYHLTLNVSEGDTLTVL